MRAVSSQYTLNLTGAISLSNVKKAFRSAGSGGVRVLGDAVSARLWHILQEREG